MACSGIGIRLGVGIFWVVGACTQAWVWALVAGWLLLVDFGRYSFDPLRDFRASEIGESWCVGVGFCWPVIVLYRLAARTGM